MNEGKIIVRQRIIIIVLSIVSAILLGICIYLLVTKEDCSSTGNSSISNQSSNNGQQSTNNISNNSSTNNVSSGDGKYKLGDTFVFDGLELSFDTSYSFTTIKNRYSDQNGKSVIKLGVNVKNVSEEKNHLNMFYYDIFGSQGIELDSISSYFDDSIEDAGDLKTGASYKTYFYILYDGDGKYSIDFDNFTQKVSIEFDIKK